MKRALYGVLSLLNLTCAGVEVMSTLSKKHRTHISVDSVDKVLGRQWRDLRVCFRKLVCQLFYEELEFCFGLTKYGLCECDKYGRDEITVEKHTM
jgi:hypothetical protein